MNLQGLGLKCKIIRSSLPVAALYMRINFFFWFKRAIRYATLVSVLGFAHADYSDVYTPYSLGRMVTQQRQNVSSLVCLCSLVEMQYRITDSLLVVNV